MIHRSRLLGVLVLGLSLMLGWVGMEVNRFLNTPVTQQSLLVTVEQGDSFRRIARALARTDHARDAQYWVALAYWQRATDQVRAGEYQIEAGMAPAEVLALLVAGQVHQYTFTIIEGWTFRQLRAAILVSSALLHDTEGLTDAEIMQSIGQDDVFPEGRFLPETYRFPRGTTESDFLRRAFAHQQSVLKSAWDKRADDSVLQTTDQVLVMASIIEKETGKASERRKISGVFNRRLKLNMRLQSDPTVIYGIGPDFDGDIRRRDLRHDTPYNTYTRHGLPPTPIALPGADAIHAAVQPEAGDALYFVASGDGGHVFSATLEAHEKAVDRYQR
ncbi:MAG TPA: endolytic transglycosylase MltG [Chromatiaceae bacterium]|jgi:UPF0755 protein|nr:endolytic transglycosylase MltG [Chromatiaceae bacterium]HIA07689.1 endolytic transglycosylase MltG [Chromatiaceae bacterium]HIN83092.1 endolytic transglycosylase MltG [Chromatiales bacterium]